jgi:hypothetical protein
MPQPEQGAVQVRGFLANVSIKYNNRAYIQGGDKVESDRAFPVIPNVPAKSKILTYPKGAWFRDEAGPRAKGRAPRGGYPTGSFDVDPIEYAFGKEVYDKSRRLSNQAGAAPLRLDQNAIIFVADKIDLKKEIEAANQVLNVANWSGLGVGGEDADGKWAAGAGNTFIADIFNGIDTIHGNTGFMPNRLIIDLSTFIQIAQESTVTDKMKTTEDKIVTPQLIASYFNLEKVFIAGAIKSTAKEKKDGTDFTAATLWEVNAGKGSGFLYYATDNPGLEQPNALYECQENFEDGQRRQTKKYREEANSRDVYESGEIFDFVPAGTDLAYLWKDTHTT